MYSSKLCPICHQHVDREIIYSDYIYDYSIYICPNHGVIQAKYVIDDDRVDER